MKLIRRLYRIVSDYTGFSRTELRGLGVLLILLLLVIAYRGFQSAYFFNRPISDATDWEMLENIKATWSPVVQSDTAILFQFDPNKIEKDSLLILGVPDRIAQNWVRYRAAGGKFENPEDIKKLYGMTDSIYNVLVPYVMIEESALKPRTTTERDKKGSVNPAPSDRQFRYYIEPFDINFADTVTLKQIRGIGSVLAERIVKYRSLLGGFVRYDQLGEIYGIEAEVLDRLLEHAYIRAHFVPLKININDAQIPDLVSHPYISMNQAKAITAYRLQHGPFKRINDIGKIHIIDKETLDLILPYLEL